MADMPLVLHPKVFSRLVSTGVLDRHGNLTEKGRQLLRYNGG